MDWSVVLASVSGLFTAFAPVLAASGLAALAVVLFSSAVTFALWQLMKRAF